MGAEGKKELLITEFAQYVLRYPDVPFERAIKCFFDSLPDEDKTFVTGCWEMCVGAAEEARTAPDSVKEMIRRGL